MDEQHGCSIQKTKGFASKPETCRLFPFNGLSIIDDFLVVAPHVSLCPLQVVSEPSGTRQESSHAFLLETMASQGVSGDVRIAKPRLSDVASRIERERRIVAMSEAYLEQDDYAAFAAMQIVGLPIGTADEQIASYRSMLYRVLGVESLGSNASVTRTLTAMSPLLRYKLLLEPDTGDVLHAELTEEDVPFILTALHALALLANQAGMQRVTFQTVMRLFEDYKHLLIVFGMLERVVQWAPTASIDLHLSGDQDTSRRFVELAKALLPSRRRSMPRKLGTLLDEYAPRDPMARIVFLKRVTKGLAGRVSASEDRTVVRGRLGLRSKTQRWALQHFSPELIVAAFESRRRRNEADT